VLDTPIRRKYLLGASGSALIGLMLATSVDAANPEPIVVQVAFVAPITITETNPLEFGSLDVAMGIGEQVIIGPDNSLSDTGANVLGGTQAAATANVVATPGRAINILVDAVTVPPGVGYFLTAWLCDYDGGTIGACDGAGLSETSAAGTRVVRVGVTLESDVAPTAGNQDGSFNLTVAYE